MNKTRIALPLAAALALVLALTLVARPAEAGHCGDDTQVVGDSYVLRDGETLNSNLIVMGGDAAIEAGARVACTVVVFGGNLAVAGTIDEDVVVFGGNSDLEGTARVGGELVTFGGSVSQAEGAEVRGGESTGFNWDRGFDRNWFPNNRLSFLSPVLGFYQSVFETLLTAMALGLLALLLVLFWPEQTAQVGAVVTTAPAAAGGLGLLTGVAVPVLGLLMAVTVCLIPVAFVGALMLAAAVVFGWVALGLIVGTRLARALRADHMSPAVAAALGTGLLSLAMSAIAQVPCVGWVPPLLLGLIGLGAVVLTRFGTRPYLGGSGVTPVPPAPPAPPLGQAETGHAPLAT